MCKPCPPSQTDRDLLRVRDLVVRYRLPGRGRRQLTAVDGVNLTVAAGQTVGLVGESGSGKSSIGAAILGLTRVSAGTVEFDGGDITNAPRARRRQLARRMQVIFQNPYGSMNPARTVGDTITETLRYNLRLSDRAVRETLHRSLEEVGLPASCAKRYPSQFSGGQRQRIAIARAIAVDPDFIVCDEAVSALDLSVQAQILNLLLHLKQTRKLSYLFISHDLAVVRHLSDKIVVLRHGHIVEQGPAGEVAEHPHHPYTRALLAAGPVPDPAEQQRRRELRHRLTTGIASL